jgi:hypothetical protein
VRDLAREKHRLTGPGSHEVLADLDIELPIDDVA